MAASLAEVQRDNGPAVAFAEHALELARAGGDSDAIASALVALGVSEAASGNLERAEELQREALAMFSATGNEPQVRQALGLLAWIAIARRDYSEAQELCEQALLLSREAGDDRGVVLALGNLGHVLAKRGNLEDAFRLQSEVLLITRDQRDLGAVADTLVEMASLATASGRYEAGAVMLGASASLREETESALDLVSEQMYDEVWRTLRTELGSEGLATAFAQGRSMALDAAVEYALASIG